MNAREIREEMLVGDHPILKQRVAYLLPVIPDHAPYMIREGIARRRIAATTGQCPCGAVVNYGEHHPGKVSIGEVLHERSCPADTAKLVKACRRWMR